MGGPSWRIYRSHVAVAWGSEEVKISRQVHPAVVTACHAVLTARGYGRPDQRASLSQIDEATAHLLWELISGRSRREDLLRDLVTAMPENPEGFWRAIGYDPHFPEGIVLEPRRGVLPVLNVVPGASRCPNCSRTVVPGRKHKERLGRDAPWCDGRPRPVRDRARSATGRWTCCAACTATAATSTSRSATRS